MKKKHLQWLNTVLTLSLTLIMISTPLLTQAAQGEAMQAAAPQEQPELLFTTLLTDDFDYGDTAGDLTAVSSGNWTAHSGAGVGPVGYITTSLSMLGYGSSGIGGSATISTTNTEDVNRTFASQATGVVYFAALVNVTEAKSGGDYFFHLRDTSTGFRGRIFVRDDSGVLRFGLAAGSSGATTPVYSTDDFDYNTTYLVVGKYTVDTGDSELYVLEAAVDTEPATPLLSMAGTASLAVQSVAIRQGGTSRPAAIIDGVRVATTWEDVIGFTGYLALTKTVTPTTNVAYQGTVSYTVVLENSMAISDTVLFTDTLPNEVTFGAWIEQPAGAVEDSGEITWSGNLTASTTLTFTFTAIHVGDYGDIVTNTAEFSGTLQAGEANATFTVENSYDVAVTKTALVDEVHIRQGAGALVSYTIQIDNLSTIITPTTSITLTDILPSGFVYVEDDSTVASSEENGVLTWVFADPLASGETISFTLVLSATDAITQTGIQTNRVVIETAPADPITGNNTAEEDVMVYRTVPISVARAGSDGEIFAIEGRVTVASGTWHANEWVLQDESGGISAYYSPPPSVSLGDVVRLIARRSSFNNQEQMETPIIYFEIVESGPPVEPITYTTAQVAAGDTEGWLIQLEGVISNYDGSCDTSHSFDLDDGSGAANIRIDYRAGINFCDLGIQNGDMLGVTGFSTQYQTTYQVKPRSVNDLQLFVDAPIVIETIPANNATNVPTDTLITIQFSEPVTVTDHWVAIQCSQSGVITATSAPAGPAASYTLTPNAPFAYGEICHVTVLADQVMNDKGFGMLMDHRFSFTAGSAPTFGVCGDSATPIHFVQGSGMSTPIMGTTVVVEAVVVGSYQEGGQFNGFFLQERDERVDDNPATSEGIFVYGTGLASVSPGELVRVRGTATEYNNLTQIASVSDMAVCGSTYYTVTPATMTLPVADMLEWEAVEGMLVSFTHELYVTEHYNLGRYGEVHLSVNDRLWNPTNVVTPGVAALAMQDLNNRSRIVLDDGINLQNPDPVIYPYPNLTYTNTLRTGALVHDLMGVVDYRANSYRIQPVSVISFTHTADRPYEVDDVGGRLTVASFNVLNYFTTLDTGDPICGPDQDMGCRGANTATEFERQRTKIINAILAMDADIVGLIEMENHHADEALIDLVAGLNEAAGAGTYAYIDTGVIGTDAIKQAFIYQPATVTPVGDYAILDSTTAITGTTFDDTKNRPVLIQTFEENSTGELVTVAVNHLKSKGSPCDDIGDPDMGDGQGNCNLTRLAAAEALVSYLATDPTNSGSPHFLIIGDLNAYAMEDPITAILDVGYTDLLREFYGDAAYSYIFSGQAGHLDHALASPSLMSSVTGATAWHINADEPRVLDYNTEYKSDQQKIEWYSPEPFRSSDHDPVIVGLSLEPTYHHIFLPLVANNFNAPTD